MVIRMNRVLLACEAIEAPMRAKGMRAKTQLALIRLWKRLDAARGEFIAAELKLAQEYGEVNDRGQITFHDEAAAEAYRIFRVELLQETAEIVPEQVGDDAALWAAMTPETLMRLEGILEIKTDEEER